MLLLGLISCREEISLELNSNEEKLVVEGHIEPGFPPYIILTKNQGYFDPIDSNTYSNIFVSDAEIIVYKLENGTEIDSINLIVDPLIEGSFGIPIFTNREDFISTFSEEGHRYNLKIKWNNKLITSSTTIPYSTPLDSLFVKDSIIDSERPWKSQIRAVITDPDTIGNNFLLKSKRIQHYTIIDSTNDVPTYINQPDFSNLLVDCGPDILVNGTKFETYFPRPEPEGGFPDGNYNTRRYRKFNNGNDSILIEEDIVLIKYCQVDLASMRFWRGVVRNSTSGGNPFAEPANLASNINGGLGVWTGYGTKYYILPILKGEGVEPITEEYIPEIWDIF